MDRKLYRSRTDSMIAGVCGGLAEYFKVDAIIVRIAAVILALTAHGAGLLAYLIFWIVIPQKPLDESLAEGASVKTIPVESEEGKTERKNGILFLLDNFFPVIFFSLGKLWPAILIVIGILVLKKGAENKKDES